VSVTCPSGHESATADYCDQCGARIEGDPNLDQLQVDEPAEDEDEEPITDQITERPAPVEAELCPKCQTPRTGDDRFCEVDGYDFAAGGNAQPLLRWEAVVTADRTYFDAVAPDGVEFPAAYEPRMFSLEADEVLVGRRSASRGIEPDIDLAGSPEDNGISHRHAVLVRSDDGSYSLVDRGSTNGTSVNGSTDLIALNEPIPLADGARIHIGAWTTITIRRTAG
jgi:hypothetical protein